ncbi:MAG: hypothetical protein F6K10_29330 [Moorea sp. SIO2B7]|nr:hypothetical protein [Moorena sp. SIO2B7]
MLINGSLAGLVSITVSCQAVNSPEAVIIGAIGAAVTMLVSYWLERWHIDDAVDAIAVHGGAGVWGILAVALFGQPDWYYRQQKAEQSQDRFPVVVFLNVWF